MKKNGLNLILILILLIGVGLLSYPTLSNYYNSFHQSKAVASYEQDLEDLDEDDFSEIFAQVTAYNQRLAMSKLMKFKNGESKDAIYSSLLNVGGNSIMGYVEVKAANVNLPIYHGTSESTLAVGVGHLEGSSLPIGGASTHTVLTGHRGLPSAKLFTDLDKVQTGDVIVIHVLKEIYTYEVDQILIVEPYELDNLIIEEGKDLCTLVTCTPYGVNSHRMLVRGKRVDNIEEEKQVYVSSEAMLIEPLVVAPVVAMPILLLLALWIMIKSIKSRIARAQEKKINKK